MEKYIPFVLGGMGVFIVAIIFFGYTKDYKRSPKQFVRDISVIIAMMAIFMYFFIKIVIHRQS